MEQDPWHRMPPGDDDPLDSALGELADLADLERSFAELDARLGDGVSAQRAGSDEDPFADIAAALREHRQTSSQSDDGDLGYASAADADADEDSESIQIFEGEDPEAIEQAREIEQLCQDALDALEEDDSERAREIALTAVRIDDEHPFPIFVLGLIAERAGDLDTARDMAELALRSAETNPDAIGLRAHIHVSQHEFEQAETLLRFGIAHNPDEAMLHEGLARVALARGRHEDALRSANTALRLEPANPGAMAVRAAALEEATDREAVLAALRQGVLLHPEDPYGMVELASMEMERGNLDRARSLLMRASRLAPSDHEIGDVRVLVDHVHTHRLLRPVPKLLKWIREFPGGLPGFVIGLMVAGLPLHAVAVTLPQYRFAALTLLGVWGAVALYAWIAPARLTHRLNQRAARASRERLERDLHDPLSSIPRGERVTDVLAMSIDARERRRAVSLATSLADRFTDESDAAVALRAFATEASGRAVRIGMSPLTAPALARALVATAGALFVTAPTIVDRLRSVDLAGLDATTNVVYGVGILALALAWGSVSLERRARLRIDEALNQVRLFTK